MYLGYRASPHRNSASLIQQHLRDRKTNHDVRGQFPVHQRSASSICYQYRDAGFKFTGRLTVHHHPAAASCCRSSEANPRRSASTDMYSRTASRDDCGEKGLSRMPLRLVRTSPMFIFSSRRQKDNSAHSCLDGVYESGSGGCVICVRVCVRVYQLAWPNRLISVDSSSMIDCDATTGMIPADSDSIPPSPH